MAPVVGVLPAAAHNPGTPRRVDAPLDAKLLREVVMNRSVFAPALTLLFCSAFVSTALAQAKPAVAQAKSPAPAAAPAAPAKAGFITPLKGEGAVQVLPGVSKFDPKLKEVVTTYKVKNMSSAPIALLKLDEYWYEKGKMVSTDTQRYRQPFQPGEIIEITTHAPAPANPVGWTKNVTFSHANGKITPKAVKKF
jgi:hypothetical protein